MGTNIGRKLATIRKISELSPIEGADLIEVATVDGWKVVVKKGEFSVGDLAIYFEIDSWVPHELAPFLTKNAGIPREYNGVKGERLRTVKLRGQISQGLLLGLDATLKEAFSEGADLTELLGVQKWEAPISAELAGKVSGTFPTHLIPKTDQERIQNCFKNIQKMGDVYYEVTMKLDGSSMTLFRWEDQLRVCSRNNELVISEENADNTFVKLALQLGDKIPNGFAFQGEVMGPGVQGNRENFKDHRFYVFDIYDIEEQEYLGPYARQKECSLRELDHVPVIDVGCAPPASVEEGLRLAEGPSINHPVREGLVWKCHSDPSFSFKTISNNFLLKEK